MPVYIFKENNIKVRAQGSLEDLAKIEAFIKKTFGTKNEVYKRALVKRYVLCWIDRAAPLHSRIFDGRKVVKAFKTEEQAQRWWDNNRERWLINHREIFDGFNQTNARLNRPLLVYVQPEVIVKELFIMGKP